MRFNRHWLALLALLAACATARVPHPTTQDQPLAARIQAPGLLFELLYTAPDGAEVGRIGSGLLAAGPRLARWGSFRQGVRIHVYPDHEALEAAVERPAYPWLRAWAFSDQVHLQSPRSWDAPPGAVLDQELEELLTHELTHSLMYQLMEPDDGLAEVDEPPLWFREGMASVTAGQGHRRLSSAELARWIAEHPHADLLHPSAELVRTEKEAVYGAAHRAFDLLVTVAGDQAVRDVLRGVRDGARFADAFKAATRQDLREFERNALRAGFDAVAFQAPARATGAGGP